MAELPDGRAYRAQACTRSGPDRTCDETIELSVLQNSYSQRVDWRADRIGSAHRGENPLVMARMRSGFAVIGDTQFLPGYSLLLTDDPTANHLTDLDWGTRKQFLFDMALVGEAVERACKENGLRRMNYEVLGNFLPVLHAHVVPRYEWESREFVTREFGRYPKETRDAPEHAYSDEKHGELRAAITAELQALIGRAY